MRNFMINEPGSFWKLSGLFSQHTCSQIGDDRLSFVFTLDGDSQGSPHLALLPTETALEWAS